MFFGIHQNSDTLTYKITLTADVEAWVDAGRGIGYPWGARLPRCLMGHQTKCLGRAGPESWQARLWDFSPCLAQDHWKIWDFSAEPLAYLPLPPTPWSLGWRVISYEWSEFSPVWHQLLVRRTFREPPSTLCFVRHLLRPATDFASVFGRASALPFVGFGEIGLSRAGTFGISTCTSFEAAAFLLLATGCLEAALDVCAWLVEADGKSWFVFGIQFLTSSLILFQFFTLAFNFL